MFCTVDHDTIHHTVDVYVIVYVSILNCAVYDLFPVILESCLGLLAIPSFHPLNVYHVPGIT